MVIFSILEYISTSLPARTRTGMALGFRRKTAARTNGGA